MVRIVNKTPTTSTTNNSTNNNNNEDKNKAENSIEVIEKTYPPDAANVGKNTVNNNNNEDDSVVTTYDSGTEWEKDSDPHPRKKQKISLESPTSVTTRNNNNVNIVNNKRCIIISRKDAHDAAATSEAKNSFSQSITNQLRPVMTADEEAFARMLKERTGLEVYAVAGDGNCLFRSVADQVYGDAEMHDIVRKNCLDFMERDRDYYSQFVTEEFDEYIRRKRILGTFGNHLEIQAMIELYNRPFEIYAEDDQPLNIFQENYATDNPSIKLSYHQGNHYNSVRDPNNPAFGVGLGMPDLKPGLADKMQVDAAINESEREVLEEQVLKTVREESDRVMDDEAIELSLIEQLKSESELAQYEQDIEEAILAQSMAEYFDSLKKK
jgi:hypothetical protein